MRAAALLLLFAGCGVPEEGPAMLPGDDCLSCHGGGGAPRWTVAGTVYGAPDAGEDEGVGGVTVQLTDAGGRELTLRTNSVGNFYTAEDLELPVTVEVRHKGKSAVMRDAGAACNSCHSLSGDEGRIYLDP